MRHFLLATFGLLLGCGFQTIPALAQEPALRQQAVQGLRRAVEFFRKEVAVQGTYLWQYSEDLAKREGEGVASATQGFLSQYLSATKP